MQNWDAAFVLSGFIGLAAIAMGTWALFLPAPRVTRWVVAYFLILYGIANLVDGIGLIFFTPRVRVAVERCWNIPFSIVAIAFPFYYPFPRNAWTRSAWSLLPIVGVILAFEALYFMDHSLMIPQRWTQLGWIVWEGRPLAQLTLTWPLVGGAIGAYFAWRARYARSANSSAAHLMLAAGFAAPPFYGIAKWLGAALFRNRLPPTPLERWDSVDLFFWITLALCIFTLVQLRPAAQEARRRKRFRKALAVLAAVTALGLLVTLLNMVRPGILHPIAGVPAEIVHFLPALAVFGTSLRFQFVDVQMRARPAVRAGIAGGGVAFVLLVAAQVAQNYMDDLLGWGVGTLVAALLVVLMIPLQRLVNRAAGVALPSSRPAEGLDDQEKLDVLRDQMEIAWRDGSINARERTLLEALRKRLDVSAEAAAALEAAVLRSQTASKRRPGPSVTDG